MKLKWQYDKPFKQWWVDLGEEGGFLIEKENFFYRLDQDNKGRIGSFRLLKSAKTVAQLLHNG